MSVLMRDRRMNVVCLWVVVGVTYLVPRYVHRCVRMWACVKVCGREKEREIY